MAALLLRHGDYKGARACFLAEIARASGERSPSSHFLLAGVGSTFYEEGDYRNALAWYDQAAAAAPMCPAVLWERACTLERFGEPGLAIDAWERILALGMKAVARGPCGQGEARARSILCRCTYRIALAYDTFPDLPRAIQNYKRHLRRRRPGLLDQPTLAEVRARLRVAEAALELSYARDHLARVTKG